MSELYRSGSHLCLMYNDFSKGTMIQANQFLIVDEAEGLIMDPGGHKVYAPLFAQISNAINPTKLKYIFFSHQDPDIIAAANGWMMVTDAEAYISALWMRFLPHFGIDELVVKRVHPIPDEGLLLPLGQSKLVLLPAHFLHSAGSFQLYDPAAKILFSGDLGASLGSPDVFVSDFPSHIQYLEGFHKRYLPTRKALAMWANTVRQLEIETIVPQHGAVLKGRAIVEQFIRWVEQLPCGLDLMGDAYPIPQ